MLYGALAKAVANRNQLFDIAVMLSPRLTTAFRLKGYCPLLLRERYAPNEIDP